MPAAKYRKPPPRVTLHPAEIEAMQCKLVAELPAGAEWQYELKWDGYRALGSKSAEGSALYSRQQKSFAETFRTIHRALASLRCKSAVVDGEVVAMVDGRPSFQALQRMKSADPDVYFFLFDLLELNGRDYRQQPLMERRALLESITPAEGMLKLSPILPPKPAELMAAAQKMGLEGIIAKRKDSVYEAGERSGAWVKYKAEQSGTFLIGGYVPGGASFDEIIIGEEDREGLRFVARVKAGFVPATRAVVMKAIGTARAEQCPFYNLPEPKAARWGQGLTADEMEKCRWVKPRVKVEVGFVEWTEGRKLRHSRFLKVR